MWTFVKVEIASAFLFSQNPVQRIFEKQTEQKILPKGQRQEIRFVCREYRGLEVLCGRIAKGDSTLLGLRGEALSRLRAAAIAQLRGVSPLSTGYCL